jgi:hypothetical protein
VFVMVANFESLTLAKSMGQRPNWSLSRWGKSTG